MLTQQVGGGFLGGVPRELVGNDNRIDQARVYRYLIENRILREDSTRHIQETVVEVARRSLVAVADLRTYGLTETLSNGIGSTTYEFDKITPVGPANQSMSILDMGERDRVTFSRTAVPVPVTGSQFRMDARERAAGGGVSLVNIQEHSRAVAEKLEDTLINGSNIVLGANTLPGYTNLTCRAQLTYSAGEWTGLSGGFESALGDVLRMVSELHASGFAGPYVLYAPSNYSVIMDNDFKADGDRTLRERIMAINGIADIKVSATLPDSEVLIVQMTRGVVEMGVGQDITVVTNDIKGGLATEWYIFAVLSFALKCANARAPLSDGVLPALTTAAGIAHLA